VGSELTEDISMATLQSQLQESKAQIEAMRTQLDSLQKEKDAERTIQEELLDAREEVEALKSHLQKKEQEGKNSAPLPPPPPPLSMYSDGTADWTPSLVGSPTSSSASSRKALRREKAQGNKTREELQAAREEIGTLKSQLNNKERGAKNSAPPPPPPPPPLFLDMNGTAHGAPSLTGTPTSVSSRKTRQKYQGRKSARSLSPKATERDQRKDRVRSKFQSGLLTTPQIRQKQKAKIPKGDLAADDSSHSFNITYISYGTKETSRKPKSGLYDSHAASMSHSMYGLHHSYTAGIENTNAEITTWMINVKYKSTPRPWHPPGREAIVNGVGSSISIFENNDCERVRFAMELFHIW
jgi:hypothetical protein